MLVARREFYLLKQTQIPHLRKAKDQVSALSFIMDNLNTTAGSDLLKCVHETNPRRIYECTR